MARMTKAKLQEILKQLPIGYYAGGRVDVTLDEEAETSYFDPLARKISVSLNGAQELAKNGKLDTETAARGHLYHELSHAILTPQGLRPNDAINIFEDERIETLLDGYFRDVDFKENVKAYAGYRADMPIPRDPTSRFFAAVRYRIANQETLDEIDRIIKEYSHLNWNSDCSARKKGSVNYYIDEIHNLYRKVVNAPPPSPQEWEQMKQVAEKRAQEEKQGQGEPNAEKEGESGSKAAGLNVKELLNQAFEAAIDKDLYNALDAILVNFSKKNSGGSSLATYSGIFNPRNCQREDFRFFDRRATVNGTNPYGTLHLNLFIDESGSFEKNKQAGNNLIRSLIALERKHSNFSVDFVFIGCKVRYEPDHTKVFLNPDGGTNIDAGTEQIVHDLQKKGTYNYNILLMDGWTYSHWPSSKGEYYPFDLSNTTFILDPDCEYYGGNKIRNGKVIYCKNYVKEFTKHIILTLQRAFH